MPLWADLLNRLWGCLIKQHVNNSSQLRYRAEIRHALSLGRSASYRFGPNARHLSKAGVLAQCLSVSQWSAVIKCADKASNKPKPSESITDFCVWREDWSQLCDQEISLREMGGRFSHCRFMDCILRCFFWFVCDIGYERIARSISRVCYSYVFSEANGLENAIELVKFMMKCLGRSLWSFFLYTDLLRVQINNNRTRHLFLFSLPRGMFITHHKLLLLL